MSVNWSIVRHFRREEWAKQPDSVLPDLVYLLDEVREDADAPILIHVAADDTGHVENSGHYPTTATETLAVAVDFHIVGWSLLDQWLFAERYPFHGLGLYPHWGHPGLHADLRRLGVEHPKMGRRWWRDATGAYKPLDRELLTLLLAS